MSISQFVSVHTFHAWLHSLEKSRNQSWSLDVTVRENAQDDHSIWSEGIPVCAGMLFAGTVEKLKHFICRSSLVQIKCLLQS